jgi:hypothetical protein
VIIDVENQFSSGGLAGQGLAGFTGTVSLGNCIDSGPLGGQNTTTPSPAGRDFGMGYPSWLYLLFVLAPVGAGATLDVQVVTSAAPGLTSPNVMLDLTGVLPITSAKFATGAALRAQLPRGGIGGSTGWLRYIGVNFVVGSFTLSGGGVLCFLSQTIQDNLIYAAGYVVQ